ncbi:Fe-S-cluster-containing hydrogenase components 1 [Gluconacetobacter johannae DSM 13595]|uniref:4Fe-4S dicluster domain-containing protein n=1 Tax=Gluconacetobacter johannae TaxID=112140 RepID=A0A7W4J582_9PROT|nr:4Fe-4S dicluster domain-containing protein [Gluconacetobacter johannae]MBB2174950.1 4Fe-4S dicluster domain-containing protein [Gluconacetobacter johannae]GBQ87918.1 Fe-S-cluster-containing hydrogenase components 1 [Gluconacetobacter johannae DSM 13595]
MPSLEGLPGDERDWVRRFPHLEQALAHPLDRRRTLKLLALALAGGGLAGCDPGTPDRGFVSAVRAAPGVIPGVPNIYASAHVRDGYAHGILVTHQMGRPTKVEGNPGHPASLGATDIFAQAAIQDFYDPDRASGPLHDGMPAAWQEVTTALQAVRAPVGSVPQAASGLRILTGTVTSPTLGAAIDALLAAHPGAVWHQWDAIGRDAARQGAALAYGRPAMVIPDLRQVDVALAVDSDLLDSAPGHLRHARAFAGRRNPVQGPMNRLYAVEPTPSLTGVAADHRFVAAPAVCDEIVGRLGAAILHNAAPSGGPDWLGAVVADLRAHPGRALIHLGPDHGADAHASVHAMNEALGGRGGAFDVFEPPDYRPAQPTSTLSALMDDMENGRVRALLILDVNPVYQVPRFAAALPRVPLSVALADRPHETAQAARWHVPLAHGFEDWGDARADDGTATILQPQAMPLYGGMSAVTVLRACAGDAARSAREQVRQTWRERLASEADWRAALAAGVVPGTAAPRLDAAIATVLPPVSPAGSAALTLLLRPDPHLWDGREANNPWLQELPRPLSKTVWGNPLLIPPELARSQGLRNGDEVALSVGAHRVALPVWVQLGQASGCVVGLLGSGRRHAGATGDGVGTDLYPLRDAAGPVRIVATGRTVAVACTEHHATLVADAPSDIVRHGTLARFRQDAGFLGKMQDHPVPAAALYRRDPGAPVAWGMSIDLNACIGCNACMTACQAENNVPVVGRDEVLRQREMHWLRIDRIYEGTQSAPDTFFQPMLCMHCEQAPCETVCPVGATTHDSEGLNVMVYNRCVGTKFCSNNCPYKVRRFNYFAFAEQERRPPISRNPDVSVRARGVMEKCTFCVQRIAQARIAADRDGVAEQVVTACQAACPTQAITFGDINDPDAAVSHRKASPLTYVVLPEQGTHPRVTYEGRIRNRNPAIEL